MLLTAKKPNLTLYLSGAGASTRSFSIQGQQAATLLSKWLDVPVTEKPHLPSRSLAVLVHADRRPQPPNRLHYRERRIFAPSLVVRALTPSRSFKQSDEGDIGLLGLTQRRRVVKGSDDGDQHAAARIAKIPFSLDKAGIENRRLSRLLARRQFQGTLADGQHQLGVILLLQRLSQLFAEGEGIYFTLFVHDAGEGGLSVALPYLEFDDYAVHRMPEELQALHKAQKREPNAAQAMDGGLFYIKLHNGGNIGSFGYGAGNAMATMDGLALAGGKPANFLDGGGGANRENARLAIETLNRDADVKSIFVNTFGGITQTDVVADGIIDAIRANNMKQPVVVRVMGTGSEEAKRKLRESGLAITIEDDFKKAARLAVEQAERASASASASASQD